MPDEILNFLLSKGTLGLLCFLLLLALGAVWKTWRDDTKAFNVERSALYEQSRHEQQENLKLVMTISDEVKTVLNDVKTNLTLLLQRRES